MSVIFNKGGPSGKGYSEVEAFLRCPHEDWLKHRIGVAAPSDESPDALAVGSMVHAGRARWFAQEHAINDETWQLIQQDVRETAEGLDKPPSATAEAEALSILTQFIDYWSIRERPEHVAVEHMLGPVSLFSGTLLGTEPDAAMRTARLDDFGRYPQFGMNLAIGECKTTSGTVADVVNQYALHGQTALQMILWDLAPQGRATYGPVEGVVMDVVVKGYKGKKCEFGRVPVRVPLFVQKWWREELVSALLQRAQRGDVTRRITSCTRMVGRGRVACPYRNLCTYGESAADEYEFKDGRKLSEWNAEDTAAHGAAPWET